MKALLCTHYGTPDDLELVDIADPTPAPGEVVVRIHAAALNFFDTLIIAGKYQTKPAFPFSPSAEFAGTVESLGAGVTDLAVGGQYAEPALRAIAWKGRYLVVGFAAGEIPKLPFNLMLLKGCDVLGVFWGSFIERDLAGHRANTEQLLAWHAEGKLSSHVHAVYPLAEAATALKAIAARKVMGKVILRP